MPKQSKRRQPRPLYRRPPPAPPKAEGGRLNSELGTRHAQPIAPAAFILREDGQIESVGTRSTASPISHPEIENRESPAPTPPKLIYKDENRGLWLYQGNSLELLDAIHAKYPEGRFDCIFADPPYFLSNGGITCHAGKMVRVDKGDWDKSRGPELNHEFNLEWLRRCQRVLKPNGTLWVSGTHHVIFSIGYALQQLGYKILNDIAWEKPNPPPNLSCRYFTHSTETILWAAKNEKSKHTFNYQEMRKVTGKQMKTVWRREEFEPQITADKRGLSEKEICVLPRPSAVELNPIWTMTAPNGDEKEFGKHPTEKPVALVERCLLASTNQGDMVLDPFLGGGTTAVACIRLNRRFIGVELDFAHLNLAERRTDREIILLWLCQFRVQITVTVASKGRAGTPLPAAATNANKRRARSDAPYHQNDLDLFSNLIDRSVPMADEPPKTDCIFHETKFVFLSCAIVSSASVIHTTVDVSLQEAWAKTPNGKKRETTHIVRCETEIYKVT